MVVGLYGGVDAFHSYIEGTSNLYYQGRALLLEENDSCKAHTLKLGLFQIPQVLVAVQHSVMPHQPHLSLSLQGENL